MDKFIEHFKYDRFGVLLGMEIEEYDKGYAKVSMTIQPEHLNAVGTLHGGVSFSLADFAFAVASNSYETLAMGISTSMQFVKAARKGVITAVARETSINPKLATYQVDITDEDGEIIGIFQGMVYRKKDSIYNYTVDRKES